MERPLRAIYKDLRRAGWPAAHALSIAKGVLECMRSPFSGIPHKGTFEYKGRVFKYIVEYDARCDRPWENSSPLAEVDIFRKSNPPKDWVSLGDPWYYDKPSAIKKALEWAVSPQHAELIVDEEIDRFSRWAIDDWWYVGVIVSIEGVSESSLWGVESDYIHSVIYDLAEDVLLEEQRKTYPVTECGV